MPSNRLTKSKRSFLVVLGVLVAASPVWAAGIVNSGTLNFTGTTSVTSITGTETTPSHYTGITNVAAASALTADYIRQDTLTIATGATALLRESSGTLASGWPAGSDAAVSIIKTLDLKDGTANFVGKLNVTNNDLILDYTGSTSPAATLEAAVRAGYNGGHWTGTGLTSSDAAARNIFTLLVLDNAPGILGTTFDNVTITTSTVIVKFTHQDDLNGDGVVTSADTAIFNTNYNNFHDSQTPITHAQGDMDFDGRMTFNDAQLFSLYFNSGLAHLPEPTSLAFLALGTAGLLARKRK